jgi:uncharacterized spore protein YtfJ
MSETPEGQGFNLFGMAAGSQQEAAGVINQLFKVAEPGVVFSPPVNAGDSTIITASEFSLGVGVGFGAGGGTAPAGEGGSGGGGGGGGASAARPVAVIIAGPGGVRVEPVVDVTKVALAFFTALGAMFMAWRAMQRAAQD